MFDAANIPTLLVLIPGLPLLAAVATAILGPKLLRGQSHWPTLLALTGSMLGSLLLGAIVWQASAEPSTSVGWEQVVDLWSWADVAGAHAGFAGQGDGLPFSVRVSLRADALTAIMLATVTLVALLVAVYSAGYMHGDRGYWRFFSYFSLFVFSMTMLVSVSNFVLLYVFWEAVGVCSYLLIGFWYEKPAAAAAGKKAFLVNRVGDFGFALGLFLIWTYYGTLNFHDTTPQGTAVAAATSPDGADVSTMSEGADGPIVPGVLGQTRLKRGPLVDAPSTGIALAICLLLMLGACGKSAQFPLHVWLPDAMEGPTPISALIHAATMVTAGVYMVTRCTPLFLVVPDAQLVVAGIGAFTALLAGIIALTQTDLKRVLAYSTISQLGYMFLALGTGSLVGIVAGMFHLFTHAFFKALLFLGAGSVMHATDGVIDVRQLGGLRRRMPLTHLTFLIGCLALAGVLPLAGFWSKDMIMAAVHAKAHDGGPFMLFYYAALFTALLTALYTFRAFFLTFYGQPAQVSAEGAAPTPGHHAHESPPSMTLPMVLLALGAVGAGFLHHHFAEFVSRTPSLALSEIAVGGAETGFHTDIAVVTTVLAVVGIVLAALLYLGRQTVVAWLTLLLRPLYVLSHGKFFFDPIYMLLVVWPLRGLAYVAYWFDRRVLDGLVDLVGSIPAGCGALLRWLQSGLVPYYAMLMVVGLLVLISSLFFGAM